MVEMDKGTGSGVKETKRPKPLRKRTSSTDWSKLEAGGSNNLDSELFKLQEDHESPAPIINITATASAFASQDDYFPAQKKQSMHKKLLFSKLTSRTPLLLFLATGTCVTLAAQAVSDLDVADSSVQILALTKFGSTLLVAYAINGSKAPQIERAALSGQCKVNLVLMGLLDGLGYASFAAGLPLCGAALSSIISAATSQLITAFLSWAVLGRRLSKGQLMSLLMVVCGLMLRLNGAAMGEGRASGRGGEVTGVLLTLASSLCFSLMNIIYEHTLRTEVPSPPQEDIAAWVAWVGLGLNLVYFACFSLPGWDRLVTRHVSSSGTGLVHALATVLLFAVLYNCHSRAQGLVMQTDGALGVGLVNVVRGTTVTLVAGALFCTADSLWRCFSPGTLFSAAVVTAGGLLWVFSGSPPESLSESAVKLARAASGRLVRSMSRNLR